MTENIEIQLAPPWITYFNEMQHSIGVGPTITVGPLIPVGGNYIILIQSTNNERAVALATLLKPLVAFGNITVEVVVSNHENQIVEPMRCPLDVFEVAHLLQIALEGNPYFQQVVVQPQLPGDKNVVFPVFTAQVIQFFNDDISNLCQTFTEVAAVVFQDVIKEEICNSPILFSTSCEVGDNFTAGGQENVNNEGIQPKLYY